MPQIINGQYAYKSGEQLPTLDSPEYKLAQTDPVSLQNFKNANPNVPFTSQDMVNYSATPSNQPVNITGTSLQNTPALNIPNVNPNTGVESLITDVGTRTQSQIDQANKEYEALQKATGDQGNKAQQLLNQTALDLVNKKGNIINTQANQADTLIAPERKALNEINTQIANEQIALRAEQDRIRTTASSKEQAQTETSALNDTYGRRLADLAIRQSAAQGNIQGIQADSDRKTALLLAPIDNAIDYFKTFGQNYVDSLNKKELAQLSYITSNLEKQKQDIKDLESAKASALMTIAQEGGGKNLKLTSAITSATSISDLASIAAGSGYIGLTDRLYKQAQTNKLNAEAAKDKAAGLVDQRMAGLPVGSPEYNAALIANSAKNKDGLAQDQRTKIAQAKQALSGLETLNNLAAGKPVTNSDTKAIFGEGSGVIQGRIRTLASQLGGDTNAATINATIQGLIPTVARGIYGEVGVLTDEDIANYKKTVGGINTPEDANRAVRYLLTDTLEKTYTNTILDAARNQQNVSGFADDYNSIVARTTKLKDDFAKPTTQATTDVNVNPFGVVVNQFTSNIYDPNKGFIIPNK